MQIVRPQHITPVLRGYLSVNESSTRWPCLSTSVCMMWPHHTWRNYVDRCLRFLADVICDPLIRVFCSHPAQRLQSGKDVSLLADPLRGTIYRPSWDCMSIRLRHSLNDWRVIFSTIEYCLRRICSYSNLRCINVFIIIIINELSFIWYKIGNCGNIFCL